MEFKRLFAIFFSLILFGQIGFAMEGDCPATPQRPASSLPEATLTPYSKAAVRLRHAIAQRVGQARVLMHEYLEKREMTGDNFFIALDIDGVMLLFLSTYALFKRASLPAINALITGVVAAVPEVLAFYNEALACDVDVYIVTARPATFLNEQTHEFINLEADHLAQLTKVGYNNLAADMFVGMPWDEYKHAVDDDESLDMLIGAWKQGVIHDIMRNPKYKNYIFLDDTRENGPTHRIPTVEYPVTPVKRLANQRKHALPLYPERGRKRRNNSPSFSDDDEFADDEKSDSDK